MTDILDRIADSTNLDLLLSKRLIDSTPEIFSGDRDAYIDWKAQLSAELEIEPYMLVLVGSAAVGVSLNPWKTFSSFDDGSDIDVAVVSARHFEDCWRFMRSLGSRIYPLQAPVRAHIRNHARHQVYWGAIATDRILAHLPVGPAWTKALAKMAKVPPTVGREINIRLYRDVDSLRAYHLRNFKDVRARLLTP